MKKSRFIEEQIIGFLKQCDWQPITALDCVSDSRCYRVQESYSLGRCSEQGHILQPFVVQFGQFLP